MCLEIMKWYIQQPKIGKHDSQERVLGMNIEAFYGRGQSQMAIGVWTQKRAQICAQWQNLKLICCHWFHSNEVFLQSWSVLGGRIWRVFHFGEILLGMDLLHLSRYSFVPCAVFECSSFLIKTTRGFAYLQWNYMAFSICV